MKTYAASIGALGLALGLGQTASAQTIVLKPLADARLRFETVDQATVPRTADAVTMRLRSGLSMTDDKLSALIEGEATLAIVGDYFDGVHGDPSYPLIADPQNIELNRAQIAYALPGTGSVTVGRQKIELADQRFVGSASFRQNDQTYDAVRVQWSGLPHVSADLTYARNVLTVNGVNGKGARRGAVAGDDVFALLGYTMPFGTMTGFAYLVDEDVADVQGYRLSSQTYGARFAGTTPIGHGLKLGYAASWARQSDYHRNPNRYVADYYLAEGALSGRVLNAMLGYEVLGADQGVALTSVQTPLASLFKFQGWADRFTTTPPDGVRDLYATAGAGWARKGTVSAINLTAVVHRYDSDRLVRHYGDEVDLLAAVRLHRTTVSARWARYDADHFATDTQKFWLTGEWSL